ncbi:hypothetical protein IAT38_000928 [Cryptococcus sp. DSM 104549]
MSKVSKPLPHPPTGASPVIPEQLITLSKLYARNAIPRTVHQPRYIYDESLNNKIAIWRGDITRLKSTMIVNAANSSLLGGGGVDGAIHRAAGPELVKECRTFGGAKTGETVVSGAYNLPSDLVAHTVGPIYDSYSPAEAAELLRSCYHTSLTLLLKHGGGSIGFSSISTGVYGYPIRDATRIALNTAREELQNGGYADMIKSIVYVVFSERDEKVYRSLVPEYFPGAPQETQPAKEAAPAESAGKGDEVPPPPYKEKEVK